MLLIKVVLDISTLIREASSAHIGKHAQYWKICVSIPKVYFVYIKED